MEQVLVFPLNEDTEVLIQNADKSTEYQIKAISSYYEDAKELEELQNINSLYCSVDFESCLQMVDAVIFAENTMGRMVSGYKNRVDEALNAGKDIYINDSLLEDLEINTKVKNVHLLQKKELSERLKGSRTKELQLPVLAVMGEGENCDKFKLQANIKTIIEKKGYKVLSVCSNWLGKFMDMEILPGFLFSDQLSLQVKIESFNNWIFKLQEKSKADIIVLGCPGGILEFDEYESNHYSEIPLAILNAVIPDYGILTLYRNCIQDEKSLKRLKDFCQMKYNTPVESFVMSEQYFRIDQEQKIIKYYNGKENTAFEYGENVVELEYLSDIEDDVKIERQIDRILKKLGDNFFAI